MSEKPEHHSHRGLNLWQRLIAGMADRISAGALTLTFPNGRVYRAEGRHDGPEAAIRLKNARPLLELLKDGDLGFARAYIDGHWDTPDLAAVLDLAMANESELSSALSSSFLFRKISLVRHKLRRNSKSPASVAKNKTKTTAKPPRSG